MYTERFTKALGGAEVENDFKSKKLHVVCVGVNALTFYNVFAGMAGLGPKASELVNTVNTKNETGTCWPKASLSLVPLTKYEDRNDFGNREVMRKHIKDALQAQSLYLKSPELLFAFEERGDFDNRLAMEVLREEVAHFNCPYTEAIYYIPG
jgi:hypothetical protein